MGTANTHTHSLTYTEGTVRLRNNYQWQGHASLRLGHAVYMYWLWISLTREEKRLNSLSIWLRWHSLCANPFSEHIHYSLTGDMLRGSKVYLGGKKNPLSKTRRTRTFGGVQVRSAQLRIYALGKAHTRSTPSSKNSNNINPNFRVFMRLFEK